MNNQESYESKLLKWVTDGNNSTINVKKFNHLIGLLKKRDLLIHKVSSYILEGAVDFRYYKEPSDLECSKYVWVSADTLVSALKDREANKEFVHKERCLTSQFNEEYSKAWGCKYES